jgi:hypothetical protein
MHGGSVDNDRDRERLRQRMDDLLRDTRALRALIEKASNAEVSRSERRSESPAPAPHRRARRPPRG